MNEPGLPASPDGVETPAPSDPHAVEAPLDHLRVVLRRIPNEPGVYRFLGEDGEVLYVGKAKALRKRVASYLRKGGPVGTGRVPEMVARARDIEWVVVGSESEALLLEDNFIKEHRPPFNLRLRDDKSYPYIEITTTDEWPRVRFFRGRHVTGNLYFGPFSSAKKVRETLELIGRIFPYRKCKGAKPGRPSGSPCLQYFIKRSLGPCEECDHDEYMDVIEQVIEFLRGRLMVVERDIERDMTGAAAARQFEKAALLRDRLAAVRHIHERQAARIEGAESFDVVGLFQGEPGGNVQVFRVRDGAVVDRQTFYVENAAGREVDAVLEEFLLEFYWDGSTVPPQVIAPFEGEAAELAALLASRRGAAVEVRAARRGPKRRLMELAQHNAELAGQNEVERLQRRRQSRIEALERLRDALGLAELPLRIECYDISNLGEQQPVASMVVFEGGVPKKAHYRKFALRELAGQDDFAAMGEVLRRRFGRWAGGGGDEAGTGHVLAGGGREEAVAGQAAEGDGGAREGCQAGNGRKLPGAAAVSDQPYDESFATLPDLVVIDGGKGQLSAAVAALRASGADVAAIGLAKQREEVFVPGRRDPLPLLPDDPGSLLLQRIRDEAHRFALTFHRQRRGADVRQGSIFDGLPGVGAVRRRKILEHFGSPERFVNASRDEIERVPGLPHKVAREIYAHLHKTG